MYMNNEHEFEYFLNKVKGALMYRGGDFEGKDLIDEEFYSGSEDED